MTNCYCGSNQPYENCCGIYITTDVPAPTPEALMRSRYSAYHQANIDYIIKTMRGPAAVNYDPVAAATWAQQVRWRKLKVVQSSQKEETGFVEFVAYFDWNKREEKIHEVSEFRREEGRWYYFDGVTKS